MIYDATQLDIDLRAAGLSIHGCDSTGRVQWNGTPSPEHAAAAAQILAAHDPDKRKNDDDAERIVLRAVVARLAAHAATPESWTALTAADRLEDARLTARLAAAIARRMIG
jgi:hypothetical protein